MRYEAAIGLLVVALAACGPSSPAGEAVGTWVGTVSAEGDVTTVVNQSGSVWGGTARLVEEASIGVDVGEDAYMLGRPGGLFATDDRIYVVDQDVPTVRVFDHDGAHLFSFGNRGQGPGEFQDPYSIGGSADGRVFVGDYNNGRINVYDADGGYLADSRLEGTKCCVRQMVVTPDGMPYWHARGEFDPADPVGSNAPMQAFGPDGAVGDPIGPPAFEVTWPLFRYDDRLMPSRFSPAMVWKLAPSGAIVWGVSDGYRFHIDYPTGQTLIVERATDPIDVAPDEREWSRRHAIASLRRGDPDFSWNGDEIPATKPAFDNFIATQDGGVWVARPGPGKKDPECDDKHSMDDWPYHSENWRCWQNTTIIDAFDDEGRFLGEIEAPEGIVLNSIAPPHIRGDTVVAAVYSPDGVIRVKRYRLTPPGEGPEQPQRPGS